MTDKRHVLIVDDEASMRGLLEEIMSGLGFEVTTAVNGEQLIVLSRTLHPDLILSDVEMPGISGDSAQVLLHSSPVLRDIPVIFISGISPEAAKSRLTLGAKERFLPKPVDVEKLEKLVRELLGS